MSMWSGDDIYFMKLALEEAEKADYMDEVPVGAIVVSEGALLGRGHNHPVKLNDPPPTPRSWRCAAPAPGRRTTGSPEPRST